MTVYAVFEVDIADDPGEVAVGRYETYRDAVPGLIERFGGRYLVRAQAAAGHWRDARPMGAGT